jgi:alpha-D-xyloside xylohydrolase
MKQTKVLAVALLGFALAAEASDVKTSGNMVTIRPDGGQAKVIRLEVMNDNIIRVRATSHDELPVKSASLMIVPQTAPAKNSYTVSEEGGTVVVKTRNVKAVVEKATGIVSYYDGADRLLLKEARDGKQFKDFTVPEREYGLKGGPAITEEMKHGLQWQMKFDSPDDEAFYGLGQHQSEEFNMKGKNEDLFQYNTKVSIPFVLSNKNYGLLWDSYSYCRFGNPHDYLQLNRAFKLYDKQGREGHLTGTYTDKNGKKLVRDEDSIYYEYAYPATSEIANRTDNGGLKNLPKGFDLQGAHVVYEGYIAPLPSPGGGTQTKEAAGETALYQFILYYAGYMKVYMDGVEVVPERWRTAWNPNSYKFSVELAKGRKAQLRIEWQPDGGESYCGLRVSEPRSAEERGQLSIWSEMAKDMDYYFISGQNLDEVISGYRTLTGKASLYPKWVLGFWQSRERYQSSAQIEETLGEFRRRHIPIDNIVQDWNYWKLDSWGDHTFEAARYPNPQAMLDSVHQMHGRFMISVWPKFYDTVENYKELDKQGWMYHQAIEDDIHDWLGFRGSFYDAYDAGARKMFWRQIDENLYSGLRNKVTSPQNLKTSKPETSLVDAWWMDASEPNVRDCTPMWYRKALCGPTALGTSTEYFNAYSTVNADAIYNGQRDTWKKILKKSKLSEPRVFLLTRSGFAGEQRFSTATWSGDIGTRWEDMRAQMTAGLNYSLSGIPFWGMDQGGFCVENRYVAAQQLYDKTGQENEDLKEWRELQTRWNQFGAFIPLFRSHGQWPLREIWNIAPDNHPAYQSFVYYDKLRYRLMPYLYSLAGWAHFKDYTLMRALVMDFGGDKEVENIGNQWMLGPALMACPVGYYKARNRSVYFPAQCGWYDLYTGEKVIEREADGANSKSSSRKLVVDAPYERIPVFVREGAIIPFGPEMEWCDEKPAELINLYVYAGRDGQFQLYEDEGTNYNYEKGMWAVIDISYDDASKTVSFSDRQGQFPGMLKNRRFNVVLVTKDAPKALSFDNPKGRMVQYDGKAVSVQL